MITVSLSDDEIGLIERTPAMSVLAMKLKALMAEIPDGSDSLIDKRALPDAHGISFGMCGNPKCDHLHMILVDKSDNPIATASCGREMLEHMLSVLKRGW